MKQILQLPIIQNAIAEMGEEVKEADSKYQKLLKRYKKIKHDSIKGASKSEIAYNRRKTMVPLRKKTKVHVRKNKSKTRYQKRMEYMKNKDNGKSQDEPTSMRQRLAAWKQQKKEKNAKISKNNQKSVYTKKKPNYKKRNTEIYKEREEEDYNDYQSQNYETKSENQNFPSELLIYNAFAEEDTDYKLPEIPSLPKSNMKKSYSSDEEYSEIIPDYHDESPAPLNDPGLITFLADFEEEINRLQNIKNRLRKIREKKSTVSQIPTVSSGFEIKKKKKQIQSTNMDSLEYLKPSEHRFKSFNFNKQRSIKKTPKKRSNKSSLEKEMYKNKLSSGKVNHGIEIYAYRNRSKSPQITQFNDKKKKKVNYVKEYKKNKKKQAKYNTYSQLGQKKDQLESNKRKKPKSRGTKKLFKNEKYEFGDNKSYNIAVPYTKKTEHLKNDLDNDLKILEDLDKKYNFLQNKLEKKDNFYEEKPKPKQMSYYKKMDDLGNDYDYVDNFRRQDSDSEKQYNYGRRGRKNDSMEKIEDAVQVQKEVDQLKQGGDWFRQMLKDRIRDL